MNEEDFIPISALQHFVFCPRQWGLIHLEGIWVENHLTTEGKIIHGRVDDLHVESREGIKQARGLDLHCKEYGLIGRADLVEFQKVKDEISGGITIPKVSGKWRPIPIEYKRGRQKTDNCDLVQLCAQTLCLEEMLNVKIPEGFVFYHSTRKRLRVSICDSLRKETLKVLDNIRSLLVTRRTPLQEFMPKCTSCSLINICLPKICNNSVSPKNYVEQAIEEGICQ